MHCYPDFFKYGGFSLVFKGFCVFDPPEITNFVPFLTIKDLYDAYND